MNKRKKDYAKLVDKTSMDLINSNIIIDFFTPVAYFHLTPKDPDLVVVSLKDLMKVEKKLKRLKKEVIKNGS